MTDQYFSKRKEVYVNVEKDMEGWVKANSGPKPFPFELLYLKLDNGKVYSGWWTGQDWFGRHIKHSDVIIAWKKGRQVSHA